MTGFVVSLVVPLPTVIQGAIGGLIALLVVSHLLDYEGSALKSIGRHIICFAFRCLSGLRLT